MTESILTATKNSLGLTEDYTVFDSDILIHINSAFSTLNQLGIGPVDGFMIEDAWAVWDDFIIGDPRLNSVKTYMYLKVRVVFDPPTTSYVLTAFNEQIKELEWRLNNYREETQWIAPEPNLEEDEEYILDGGGA